MTKPRTKPAPARKKAPAKRKPAPKPAATRGRGRPTKFSQELADKICRLIADGRSLRGIMESEVLEVDRSTVRDWLERRPDFAAQYARARKDQGDASADEVIYIGEQMRAGKLAPDVARVAIDAVKWNAGMMRADKYGPKVDVNHTGEVIINMTPADAKQA